MLTCFYSATNDLGRGLVMPYSVIGIIFLGLMINSSESDLVRDAQTYTAEA